MRSKSSLFLIERLIVIAVFAICAAVNVRIFAESYLLSNKGSDINNALIVAKNGAESFKAANGDISRAVGFIGENSVVNGHLLAFYDHSWAPSQEDGALYVLRLIPYEGVGTESSLTFGQLSVERLGDGALSGIIIEMTIAARKDEPYEKRDTRAWGSVNNTSVYSLVLDVVRGYNF